MYQQLDLAFRFARVNFTLWFLHKNNNPKLLLPYYNSHCFLVAINITLKANKYEPKKSSLSSNIFSYFLIQNILMIFKSVTCIIFIIFIIYIYIWSCLIPINRRRMRRVLGNWNKKYWFFYTFTCWLRFAEYSSLALQLGSIFNIGTLLALSDLSWFRWRLQSIEIFLVVSDWWYN